MIVGALYSLSGGSTYTATALIAPGQAFNPSGATAVLSYLSSPPAIKARSPRSTGDARGVRPRRRRMTVGELRGHVTTSTVNGDRHRPAANAQRRPGPDHGQLGKAKTAEDAANALAEVDQERDDLEPTSSSRSRIYEHEARTIYAREAQDARRPDRGSRTTALSQSDKRSSRSTGWCWLTELDQAEARVGQTLDNADDRRSRQLTLAQDIEVRRSSQQASAEKIDGPLAPELGPRRRR